MYKVDERYPVVFINTNIKPNIVNSFLTRIIIHRSMLAVGIFLKDGPASQTMKEHKINIGSISPGV